MYNVVVKWKKTYVPNSIFSNVSDFTKISELVENDRNMYQTQALSINVFDGTKLVASLKTVR